MWEADGTSNTSVLVHVGASDSAIDQQNPNMTNMELFWEVSFEALLWGWGTAIGELPPYLVARAARLAGKTEEELKEIEENEPVTMLDKVKSLIYKSLQKHAFLTVLACASIPNPLFDLAGIMCGHFLIPFSTFFIATSIGKALFKTVGQVELHQSDPVLAECVLRRKD